MRPHLTTVKVSTLIVFLSATFSILAQDDPIRSLIRSNYEQFPTSIQEDPNFKKAYQYFQEKEYDSTLLYSHNFLNSQSKKNTYSDYCTYFRGVSFKQKNLYNEAQKEFQKIQKPFVLYYSAKMKIATIYLELEEYAKSLEILLEIKELPDEELKRFEKDIIYHDIGVCYLHLEQYDPSEKYLLESLQLQRKKQDTSLLIGSYMDIANLYYVQYKDDQAIPYFEKAYNLAALIDDFTLKQNAALNMAVVEEERKDYIKSLQYRKEYEQWRDSLNDQNKIWEVAQLEKKFISEKKQGEIELLEKDNNVKKAQLNTFIYSSILLILLIAALLYFYLSKRKSNRLIMAQKQKLDALNDTKDRLFSVVSHDLRSNVNALDRSNSQISGIVAERDFDNLGPELNHHNELTGSIKGLLDNMLNWALLQTEQMYFHQENVSLAAIVNQTVHNYTPLLNSKEITLNVDIPKSTFVYIDIESIKIVLRNVLDNAIKFCNAGDEISIYSKNSSDSQCQLIVADTGVGISESALAKIKRKTVSESKKINQERTGLGLHLCHEMAIKNGGTLDIESQESRGTQVIITLPLSKDYE